MQQFFAILKDSYREAVDGFVIYVMLGLALVVALIVGSITFTPDPAPRAVAVIVSKFTAVFPDKGKSKAFTAVAQHPVKYSAENAESGTDGTVKFVLDVAPERAAVVDKKDGFRYAVFTWSKPAGEKFKNPFGDGKAKGGEERRFEIVLPPEATAADLAAVTDDDMAGFLKSQFAAFVGVTEADVSAKRVAGVAEPSYRFEVELKRATTARGWPQTLDVFFRQVSLGDDWELGQTVFKIENGLVGWIGGTGTLVISVIITAFFIPNMLRKGSIDLLISKPIGRTQLLVYKYIGGLVFISIITSFTITLVWIAISFRAGYWDPTFLLTIPTLLLAFAILYALSTAVAVFTRSAIASILITIAFMFGLFIVGQAKTFFDVNRVFQVAKVPDWAYTLVDTLHAILPRYKDLDRLTSKLLIETNLPSGEARTSGIGLIDYPSWGMTIGVSLAFIVVMLALSCWKLNKRDN